MVVSRLFGFVVIAWVVVLSSDPSFAISPPSPSPSPPSLSNTFLDPHVVIQIPSELSLNYNSSLYQYVDPVTSEIYSRIDSNYGHLFGQSLNETFLVVPPLNGSEAYVVMNGICRTLPSAYLTLISSFQILQFSSYEGLQNVTQPSQGDRTVECQIWNFNHTINFYIDNFHTSNLIRIEANTANLTMIADFSPGFQSNPPSLSPSSSVFQVPDSCLNYHVCEVGPVIPIEVYNWHSVDDFWLNNTNTADLIGDTFFVCTAQSYDLFQYFQWISQWQVMVNSTWGQYTLCNFGQCVGGDTQLVGREAGDDLNPNYGGQCAENPSGTWYSFPAATGCTQDQSVGEDGCTWKVLMRSKTINASCIFNNTKFLSSCGVSLATGDWTASSQLFAQGFLSDDPSEGGCPPVAINAANSNENSRVITKRMETPLEKMNTGLFTPRMALQHLNKLFAG